MLVISWNRYRRYFLREHCAHVHKTRSRQGPRKICRLLVWVLRYIHVRLSSVAIPCFYVSLITVLSIWWILWPHDERNAVSICVVWCRDKQSRCCVSDVKILFGWRSVGSTKERSLNCVTSYGKTRIEPLTINRTTSPMASAYSAVMYQSGIVDISCVSIVLMCTKHVADRDPERYADYWSEFYDIFMSVSHPSRFLKDFYLHLHSGDSLFVSRR
jgi:hypothetical protein